MNENIDNPPVAWEPGGIDWAEGVWKASWTYIRTVVDTVREPFIILDKELRVLAANETFYRVFEVPVKDTEGKKIYDLGDGQWDIPILKKLLKDIIVKDSFFRGFKITHDFPKIGKKVMLLNARRIYQKVSDGFPTKNPIILLAIEDITEYANIAEKLASKTKEYETKMISQSEALSERIAELAGFNKTFMGFNKTITDLTSVIEDLRGEITQLRKKSVPKKKKLK